ncbi:MAG: hypothetical protein ACOCV0_00385 [Alkalispirochaeta sp.]
MERYVRIAVPPALAGLVLSLLVGMIAGVGFGTALFRGVISGVVFGAGAVGIVVLIERLLPGLATPPDESGHAPPDRSAAADADVSSGGRVNIVVEEEPDTERQPEKATDDNPRFSASNASPDTDVPEADEADPDVAEMEPLEPEATEGASSSDRGPSRDETHPPSVRRSPTDDDDMSGWDHSDSVGPSDQERPNSSDEDDDEGPDEEDLVEEVEEQSAENAEALMKEAITEQRYGSGVEIDDSVLDEMPDIGSFSGAFVENIDDDADQSGGAGFSGYDGGDEPVRGGGGRSRGGSAKDPATVAKAIKTMLSRDGKE